MLEMQYIRAAARAAISGLGASIASASVITFPIGNPGNTADPTTGFGSVAYTYNIAANEVTNSQYVAFLNAVAATDTNSLYNTGMAGFHGGITRSGAPGSYSYATVSGRENNPVNYVSFWDATRFANWLHNGQPTGAQTNSTTEDGTYSLTPDGIEANTITRNAGWQWAVTSEDEWYKAAFHQPAAFGGDSDDYWLYPTSSNLAPTTAQANFENAIGTVVPVGSYTANFYGTYDMCGNVFEWNDTIISGDRRGIRGESFDGGAFNLGADNRSSIGPSAEFNDFGFRVSQVPEPSSVALLALGAAALRRGRGVGR